MSDKLVDDFAFGRAWKVALVLAVLIGVGNLITHKAGLDWILIPQFLAWFVGALMLVYIIGIIGSMLKGRRK